MSEYDKDSMDSKYYPSENNDGDSDSDDDDGDSDNDDDDPNDSIPDNNAPLAHKLNDAVSVTSEDDLHENESSPSVDNNVSVASKEDDAGNDSKNEPDSNTDSKEDCDVSVHKDGSEDSESDAQHQSGNTAGVGKQQDQPKTMLDSDRVEDVMDQRYGQRNHSIGLRPRREWNYNHHLDHQYLSLSDDHGLKLHLLDPPMNDTAPVIHLTEQMSFNKGMATFEKDGATSVIAKLSQLDYWKAVELADASQMMRMQRRGAL